MKIITLGKYGALGNNFFRFIHLISFSKEHNIKLFYSDRKNIDYYFDVDNSFVNTLKTPRWLNIEFLRSILRAIDKKPRWVKVLNRLNIYLHDHINDKQKDEQLKLALQKRNAVLFVLRDFRYNSSLEKYVKTLRNTLDVKSGLTKRVEDEYNSIRTKYKILIGVHVRRGDYKDWHNGRYYFSDEVFVKKIREFIACKRLKNEETGVIICSNGEPKIETFSGLNIHYSPRPEEEDLYLMKRCDYIIAPPSTFCSMSSFMGSVPMYFIENEESTQFEQRLHICSY